MQPENIVISLSKTLSTHDLPTVVAGLRRDPLVWDKLEKSDFYDQANAAIGSQAGEWNPASLALIALGQPPSLDTLRSVPLKPIEPELRQQAVTLFEATLVSPAPPADLAEAGLLALALRERRRVTGNWQGLYDELAKTAPDDARGLFVIWRTPLACLFALSSDSLDLLKSIVPANPRVAKDVIRLAQHVLLCNPLDDASLLHLMTQFLTGRDAAFQLDWCVLLKESGKPELSAQLSSAVVQTKTVHDLRKKALADTHSTSKPDGERISVYAAQQLAQFYQLAGVPASAAPFLDKANQTLRAQEASILGQIADIAAASGDRKTALESLQQAHDLLPNAVDLSTRLAVQLAGQARFEDAQQILLSLPPQPGVLFSKAATFHQAHDLTSAQAAADELVTSIERSDPPALPFTYSEQIDLVKLLIALSMYDQASKVCVRALRQFPADQVLLDMHARALSALQENDAAIHAAYLATSLSPQNPEYHRTLAGALEGAQEWESCLEEREVVAHLSPSNRADEYLELASSAVKAGKPTQAVDACQAALVREPKSALAHTIWGDSLAQQGSSSTAIDQYTQAIAVQPDEARAWLGLYHTYEKTDDHKKAVETLKSGAMASPQSAELQLALGSAYIQDGSPTDALPALRRAATLDPHTPEVTLQLGKTLLDLGHLSEAGQVLERGRFTWPSNPELAYVQARTLLALDRPEDALPALKTVLKNKPADIEPYLLFGRTMVSLSNQKRPSTIQSALPELPLVMPHTAPDLQEARHVLLNALEMDPENFEARVLMAETQAASGALQEALETYLQIAESPMATQTEWSWRINYGLGRVALSLKQLDTAIAALQEACTQKPDDLEVQQTLAEAYLAAQLTEESVVRARTALNMAPNSLQNLVWFARMSSAYEDDAETINALERAVEVAPHRVDLVILLAKSQTLAGDRASAVETLKKISEMPEANPDDLRRAAASLYHSGEPEAAVIPLRKAVEVSPSPDLWAELAHYQNMAGNGIDALESLQAAMDLRPSDPVLYYKFGDLLSNQDHDQAAISSFEQSLKLMPSEPLSAADSPDTEAWSYKPVGLAPAGIHMRIARVLRKLGDLPSALKHAEDALHLEPDTAAAHILAADLAAASLANGRAEEDAAWQPSPAPVETASDADAQPVPSSSAVDPTNIVDLYCVQAEIQLENGDIEKASVCLDKAKALNVAYPRMLADCSRLLAMQGKSDEGYMLLETAISELNTHDIAKEPVDYPTLSLASAALELGSWQTALSLFRQTARNSSTEPRAHFCLARAMIRAAEAEKVCKLLQVEHHSPGNDALSASSFKQIEEELRQSSMNASSALPEIDRWRLRAKAVFQMDEPSIQKMAKVVSRPDEIAALVVCLGQAGNFEQAEESAQVYPDQPAVRFQHALSLMEFDPARGLEIAQPLLAIQPDDPMGHALRAHLAYNAGQSGVAITCMEAALSKWPDEPAWQAFAAECAMDCGDFTGSLAHWKKACDLEPDNLAFIRSTGQAYLDAGDTLHGIEQLKRAVDQQPERPEGWISLAKAQQLAGDLPQAIACAEKAIQLAPGQPEAILISGEISLSAHQIDQALARAEEVLQSDPSDTHAVLLASHCKAAAGKPAEALQSLEIAIPILAEPYPVLLERVKLLREVHGAPSALEALNDLVKKYPDEPAALSEYALALAEAGQPELAEKNAQAALQLQPYQASLHLMLGRIQHSTGQLDQCIHHLCEAIHLDPADIEAYLVLGQAYQDRREQELALETYDKASQVAPGDPRPYYQAGIALKDVKDYEKSEAMLRHAAELAPDDVNIRRQLGAIIAINLVHNPQEAPIHK